MKKLLFISGVARSGTSALVRAVNQHPKIQVGQERYYWRIEKEEISALDFEKDRFLDVRKEDTHNMSALQGSVEERRQRYDDAVYIGDKFPNLYKHYDNIFSIFPEARHIYILRNPLSVLESFDARQKDPNDSWKSSWEMGMDVWNDSIRTVANFSEERLRKFIFVRYEEIYRDAAAMNRVFEALGLNGIPERDLSFLIDKASDLNATLVPRRDDIRLHIAQNSDWSAYAKLDTIINKQDYY